MDCNYVQWDGKETTPKPILYLDGPLHNLAKTQFNDKLQSFKCTRAPKHSTKIKKSDQATEVTDASMASNDGATPLCPKLCADKRYQRCDIYGDTCVGNNQCRTIDYHPGLSSATFDNSEHWDGHMECDFFTDENCHFPKWPWQWLHLNAELDNFGKKGFNDKIKSYQCTRVKDPPPPPPDPCCWTDCGCPSVTNGPRLL